MYRKGIGQGGYFALFIAPGPGSFWLPPPRPLPMLPETLNELEVTVES